MKLAGIRLSKKKCDSQEKISENERKSNNKETNKMHTLYGSEIGKKPGIERANGKTIKETTKSEPKY